MFHLSCCLAAFLNLSCIAQALHVQMFSTGTASITRNAWDGSDIHGPELPISWPKNAKPKPPYCVPGSGVPNRTRRAVHIFGLQNTGTNLLYQMLALNLRLSELDEQNPQIDFYAARSRVFHGIWKHANLAVLLDRFPDCPHSLSDRGVVPLVMVRNPMSWMQSVRKAPYNLKYCTSGNDWLVRECFHPGPIGKPPGLRFQNLQSVWVEWMQAYNNMTAYGFRKPIIIRYEDLVQHPNRVMAELARELNVTIPEHIIRMEAPSKLHGDAVGHSDALQKILKKTYLDLYSGSEKESACASLDKELMNRHGYHDCDGFQQH